jgi:hypothetical protein
VNRFVIVTLLVGASCSGPAKKPAPPMSAVERQRQHKLAELPDAGQPECDCKVVCECTDVPISVEEKKLADAIAADCRRKDIVCKCPMCDSSAP